MGNMLVSEEDEAKRESDSESPSTILQHKRSRHASINFRSFLPDTSGSVFDFYRKQGDLGEGAFGDVWLASERIRAGEANESKGRQVAVKRVRKPNSEVGLDEAGADSEEAIVDFRTEVELMRALDHPSICRLLQVFEDAKSIYLVIEHITGGELFERISEVGSISEHDAAGVVRQVASALAYCHARGVVHRDIKPENILLDIEGHAKLADFGWSNVMNNAAHRATFCGTPDYLAPEMIRGDGHNESLDMWEMGVLLYEMVVGKSPFGSKSQETTCRMILKGDLKFPAGVDADAQDLVVKLCKVKPADRLTAKQAKQHPFVIRFLGRPTELVSPAPGQDLLGRPSVEACHLRREKEMLEGEMVTVLQAKSVAEETLLNVTDDLTACHEGLRHEQHLHRQAETKLEGLRGRKEQQRQEMEELGQKMQALAAEAERLGARQRRQH
mmetsp:Transcript_116884/g.372159  ORF Transcript_116884/g.372159 Transcript_116884/m.372159 type:complete len:443 (+) Transcript_116884:111-1439(+)